MTTSPVLMPIRTLIGRQPVAASSAFSCREPPLSVSAAARAAEGVVLVGRRDAEDRHHRVADELLDRATVPLQRQLHDVEVAAQHVPRRLRIGGFAAAGGVHDIGEEDGYRLALLGRGVI